MSDLLRLITLQDANTRTVLLGTAVLGLAAGVVGALAVLRKRALAGDAVAHAALPGVCAAYFIIGERSFAALLLGALIFGLLAAAFIAVVRTSTRVKEDAATALAIGSFFGLGIAMSRIVQNQPGGNRAGLDGFLFGKAASMVNADAALIGIVAMVVLAVVVVLYKEFKLLCFDRAFAESIWGGQVGGSGEVGGDSSRRGYFRNWRVHALDLLLMGLVAVCTVVGLPAVGVVLVVGLLIIPAAAARFWTDRLAAMIVISGAIGLFAGLFGTALSAALPTPAGMLSRGWPTGPMITLVAASVFVVSLLVAPRRGVIADVVRRARLRRKIGVQHVLRWMYEQIEDRRQLHALERILPAGSSQPARAISHAAADGLIVAEPGGHRLTRYGLDEASKLVRAHRLWELFLTDQVSIAPDHVHRDADEVEHFLPRELIEKLEARLARRGDRPALARVPDSVHPIASGARETASAAGIGGRHP